MIARKIRLSKQKGLPTLSAQRKPVCEVCAQNGLLDYVKYAVRFPWK